MFKVLVLQKCHGLSDDATEEPIFDRTSFKSFLGLRIGDDIPDAKTLVDFKQRIEAEGREGGRKLFAAFDQILEGKGFTAREGSIADANFGEAPRQRNSREQNRRIKEGQHPGELDTNPLRRPQKRQPSPLDQEEARSPLRLKKSCEGRFENQAHHPGRHNCGKHPRQPGVRRAAGWGKTKPCWPTAPITAPSMKMCLIKAQRAGVPDAQSHTLPIP